MDTYKIVLEETTLEWVGYRGDTPENESHQGMISISKGELMMVGETITSGTFTIDMETIKETTDGAEEKESSRLVGHLGTEDFFNISSFPIAELVITGSQDKMAFGLLKVMGKEIEVQIPIEMNVENGSVSIASEFSVDFTALNLPGMQKEEESEEEEKISDKVNFSLRLSAKK